MGLNFIEVHLDQLDQQRRKFPLSVLKQLSKCKVDREQLPALVHADSFVEGQSEISYYLCYQFGHKELFGSTIFIRVRIVLFRPDFENYLKFTLPINASPCSK
jgi:hypothetical protein